VNDASCPWMPRIKDLTLLGPMGVLSSACIMAGVHTRALTAPRRSSLLHPAATPLGSLTPAEAPLIDAEKSVQTTGTTSDAGLSAKRTRACSATGRLRLREHAHNLHLD
jgi:hypothetical protein